MLHVPTGIPIRPLLKNPPPDPNHVRDGYSKADIVALLSRAGFSIEEVQHTCGFCGSLADDIFMLTRYPLPFRLVTFPLTAALVAVDVCLSHAEGRGVLVRATKAP